MPFLVANTQVQSPPHLSSTSYRWLSIGSQGTHYSPGEGREWFQGCGTRFLCVTVSVGTKDITKAVGRKARERDAGRGTGKMRRQQPSIQFPQGLTPHDLVCFHSYLEELKRRPKSLQQ